MPPPPGEGNGRPYGEQGARRAGESKTASKTSIKDPKSAPQRGGQRSGSGTGPKGPTRDQLYNEAKQRGIEGRSNMTKDQLAKALGR
ncbi:hypothetical protein GCM10017744_019550 [Streptomyces antimycoticus]